MTLAILGPLLAFVGLFIAAYLARNRETEKSRKDRLTEAYTRLLDAAANNSGPQTEMLMRKRLSGQPLDADEAKFVEESQARWVNAHASVLIHGSKEVIGALSRFYDSNPNPLNQVRVEAYIELIKAMRHDSNADDYESFGAHVDNIMGTGPMRREAAMKKLTVTFTPPKASS